MSDCSTECWEFVPYNNMPDYTHTITSFTRHFVERPMSIVVRAITRENQPPKSEVEGCSLLTFKQPVILLAMAVPENSDEMAILLQEALGEMREQRQQNIAIMEQNHRLMERLQTVEEQLSRVPQTSNAARRRKERIAVSLHTRVRLIAFCIACLAIAMHNA